MLLVSLPEGLGGFEPMGALTEEQFSKNGAKSLGPSSHLLSLYTPASGGGRPYPLQLLGMAARQQGGDPGMTGSGHGVVSDLHKSGCRAGNESHTARVQQRPWKFFVSYEYVFC